MSYVGVVWEKLLSVKQNIWYYCGQNTKYSGKKFIVLFSKRSMIKSVQSGDVSWKSHPNTHFMEIFSNCKFTTDRNLQNESSAIIFHMPNLHWENYSYPRYRWTTELKDTRSHMLHVSLNNSRPTLEIRSKTGSSWRTKVPLTSDRGAPTGEGRNDIGMESFY